MTNLSELSESELSHIKFDCCLFLAANGDPAYSVKYPIDDLQKNTLSVMNCIESLNIKNFMNYYIIIDYERNHLK